MSSTPARRSIRRARHPPCSLGAVCASLLLFVALLALPAPSLQSSTLGKRDFVQLSSDALAALVAHPDPVRSVDPSDPASHLSKILIPRAPDTANNTLVRAHIVDTLKRLKWEVEEDAFEDATPYGRKKFTNVIATKDPGASRRVILAAHFDSKYFSTYPDNQFVGATDSAAPCAFMLDLAETLNPFLDQRSARLEAGDSDEDEDAADTTLQLVFFDGEEAFKDWTATDSIYGARHLAQKWASTYVAPHTKRRLIPFTHSNEISGIEHLILLDLLGAKRPLIRASYRSTGWLFDQMASAERRLAESGAFIYEGDSAATKEKWSSFFAPRTAAMPYGFVEDDHIPFEKLGVDILHVIATPFPRVWHTLQDDASALDIPTMRRWNLILRVFMCEYLGLRSEDLVDRRRVERSHSELQSDVSS